MIDPINSNMSMYNTATYDAAKEKADTAAFADVLRKTQQAAENKKTGKLQSTRKILTEEEKNAELDKKLREACQGFEAMFMELMYKKMRDTVPDNELYGTSNAEKIWHSMLDSEMMQSAAKAGGVGLGEMLYQQLKPTVLANQVNKNA